MVRELQTASDVIDALGGTAATARLTDRRDQHISNWRKTGRLPANTFLILTGKLQEIDCAASPELWGIKEPAAL